jgi:outer membrane protein assembly factor BamD
MHRNLFALLILVSLAACASSKDEQDAFLDSDIRSAEEIYNNGLDYIYELDYLRAIDEFKRVEDQYPYSSWVRSAIIMTAWAHYLINQYDAAAAFLDRYISLYPGTDEIAYVYYLKAMCFYERIGEVNRDPSFALQAQANFRQLIGFFPNSVYARDGKFKLDLVEAALAATEMHLGRQALADNQYSAALNRFKRVITSYNQTAYTPEALHRQVELYTLLGLDQEALRLAAFLSFNYSDSVWYKHTYNLLKQTRINEKPKKISANPKRG